ncbi:MAG: tetratricopeptide repeat protein [Acidobacteriota bacterium]
MTVLTFILGLFLHFPPSQGTFAVIGTVRDTDGQRVTSIRVSLLDENYHSIRTVFVDSSGRFQFRGLRQGVYLVRIEPVGTPYEEQTQRVEFQSISGGGGGAEEPFMVDFVLKRKTTPGDNPAREVIFTQTIPDAARIEYERGAEAVKGDKFEQADAALKKAIGLFPDYFLALELLGTEYVKRGQFDLALPLLAHAVEVNRRAPKSLYALGVANLKLNHLAESIEWLKKAASEDSSNPNTYVMLGQAYGNNREYDQSATALKKAIALGGNQVAEVHFYLASIYNKQGKYAEAVKELEIYLKEGKDIDRVKIKAAIDSLKAKEKAKN